MHQLFERKQRTRQHVIADQSINYLEKFILDEGHTAQRILSDYGYDLVMMTFDQNGYAESGLVFFQVKATENLLHSNENFAYDNLRLIDW